MSSRSRNALISSKRGYSSSSYQRQPWWKRKNAKYAKSDARRNIVRVTRGPTPTSAFVKLKISGLISFNIDLSNQFNMVDIISVLNDPTNPAGFFNYQPTGFDQWSAMFQNFTVVACGIKAHLVNVSNPPNTQALGQLSFTILPSTMTLAQVRGAADTNGPTGQGNHCDLLNDRFARTVYLGNPNSGKATGYINHYIKLNQLYPQKNILDEDDYTGHTASWTGGATSPIITPAWFGYMQATEVSNGTTIQYEVQLQVTITMYTKFSSPVNVFDA